MSIFSKIFGNTSSAFIADASKIVIKINAFEDSISKLQDADFPIKTKEFKAKQTIG